MMRKVFYDAQQAPKARLTLVNFRHKTWMWSFDKIHWGSKTTWLHSGNGWWNSCLLVSLHSDPSLCSFWHFLILHSTSCCVMESSTTEVDAFTMQVHYNCVHLLLPSRTTFKHLHAIERLWPKHQFLTCRKWKRVAFLTAALILPQIFVASLFTWRPMESKLGVLSLLLDFPHRYEEG